MSALGLNWTPEKIGLETVAEIDGAESYEFDLVTVWRETATGKLWAAHDSGCSCPTPYEDHVWPTDFTEVRSIHDVTALIGERGWHSDRRWGYDYGPSEAAQLDFLRTVELAFRRPDPPDYTESGKYA